MAEQKVNLPSNVTHAGLASYTENGKWNTYVIYSTSKNQCGKVKIGSWDGQSDYKGDIRIEVNSTINFTSDAKKGFYLIGGWSPLPVPNCKLPDDNIFGSAGNIMIVVNGGKKYSPSFYLFEGTAIRPSIFGREAKSINARFYGPGYVDGSQSADTLSCMGACMTSRTSFVMNGGYDQIYLGSPAANVNIYCQADGGVVYYDPAVGINPSGIRGCDIKPNETPVVFP